MTIRPSLLLVCAACSSYSSSTERGVPAAAASMPVPLTAATVQIAATAPVRDEVMPPWSLTASDGSGLALTRVDAKAVFEGPLAFTELHLWFHNPEARVREGTFAITLAQNAAVSRFAMENNGQWMEAEVVEKAVARRAYDDFLHRRQDPALLEKAAGNQFNAKVFPIAANADKHIVISYSQELPGAQYVLPLRGLPKTERVDVALAVVGPDGKRSEQKLNERNWQPDRDFSSKVQASAAAVIAGNVVAVQVTPYDGATAKDAPKGITILVDTSASRALGFETYVKNVRALVQQLAKQYGDGLRVQVIAFDQDVESVMEAVAGDFGDAHVNKLLERGAAGASDLGQALAWVGKHSPRQRVLIVSDGVITAGDEGAALKAKAAALASAGVERVDVVLAGGLRDDKAGELLVRALPKAGAVLDLDGGAELVARAVGEPVATDIAIDVPGARWVYPRKIETARPGQHAMVYARLAQPMQQLTVMVGGKPQSMQMLVGTPALVERAVAAAEIADLDATLALSEKADERTKLREEIAKKSIAARVVSSQTSLLVLESDADYARYGIERTALADVLVVSDTGLVQMHRKAPAQIAAPDRAKWTATADQAGKDKDGKGKNKEAQKRGDVAREEVLRDARTAGVLGESNIESFDFVEEESGGQGTAMALDEGRMGRAAGSSATITGANAGPGGGGEGHYRIAINHAVAPEPPPPPPSPTVPEPVADLRRAQTEVERAEASGHRANQPAVEVRASGFTARPNEQALEQEPPRESWPPKDKPAALKGELADIAALAKRDLDKALAKARDWHAKEPGNVLALIGLGDALEKKGSYVTAARVYGSIIDLYPGRADMRRFAGERLERVSAKQQDDRSLVIDTYRRAVEDRPDHVTGHRLLAYALVRAGKHADAFAAIMKGLEQNYPANRFAGADRVLAEDAQMIGAVYAAKVPSARGEIAKALAKHSLEIETQPSTRFILYWETDANDVDFHIQDARGGHAFYSSKVLPSGGELYADITTGYGPECFTIKGKPTAGPYRLSIDYYSQGPMGFGMGLLQVQRFDGKSITIEDRPYVIMNDHAYTDLGSIN